MISMHMFQRVRQLNDEGLSRSEIARRLKIDRRTVGKYLRLNAPPRYARRERPTKVDLFVPFSARVQAMLDSAKADLTACEVFVTLVEAGYTGSERTVERRLAAMRESKPKERFFAQVYEPGEQAQFDFKESVTLPFQTGPELCHLHFGTLPFSDTVFIKAFPFKNFEAFIDGIHSFFEHVGGITTNVRIDNLSPCVKKVRSGSERDYTAAFERAIAYYGFGVLPCAPGKGSDKGDVERDIRTYARRVRSAIAVTGRIFADYDDLNIWLSEHVLKWRKASTTERLTAECQTLRPLPPRDSDVLCKVELTTVNSYGLIRIGRSTYSAPDEAIGLACRAEQDGYEVVMRRVGGDSAVITRHPRKVDGEHSVLLEHVLPSLLRKPHAMVRWAHRHILFPLPGFRRFYDYLQTTLGGRAEREFLRAVNLVQHASLADIGAGMEILVEETSQNPLDDLKKLLGLGDAPAQLGEHQKAIKPELSQYDTLIPTIEEISA